VISGVPQGTVLGLLLFLCYINDLPSNVKSTVKLYADDVVLYRAIYTAADHDILQQDLLSLTQWAKTWQMSFNLSNYYVLPTNKIHQDVLLYEWREGAIWESLWMNV